MNESIVSAGEGSTMKSEKSGVLEELGKALEMCERHSPETLRAMVPVLRSKERAIYVTVGVWVAAVFAELYLLCAYMDAIGQRFSEPAYVFLSCVVFLVTAIPMSWAFRQDSPMRSESKLVRLALELQANEEELALRIVRSASRGLSEPRAEAFALQLVKATGRRKAKE